MLADAAADLGIERFVLDDGWFGSRRDDTKGLGDWRVSEDVYPDGLTPLIGHVTGLGMEFGIWVEPEMVNPDSDVFRAHPDWALISDGYEPVLGRQQLVLDLGNPAAFAFIDEHLDALLRDHDIAYVKWDMNRDHIQGSGRDGAAGTHVQTVALYRLLDVLRAKHPTVEFESCASGGARIDHEILRRTERVWTSDCNDALERQTIQRGASMLIPPEVMGAHIGPTTVTHDRTHPVPVVPGRHRSVRAPRGRVERHRSPRQDRTALRAVIAMHKEHRELLHTGDTVRFSTDPAFNAHGVYARDRSQAIVSFAQLTTRAESDTAAVAHARTRPRCPVPGGASRDPPRALGLGAHPAGLVGLGYHAVRSSVGVPRRAAAGPPPRVGRAVHPHAPRLTRVVPVHRNGRDRGASGVGAKSTARPAFESVKIGG